ncbi:hypothetical protein BTR23_07555 [Alkalihalophilus pseudofirmus]|nr:hypothetical protein BTR23_07555 [Alkalihalophilus pseudofirmus]
MRKRDKDIIEALDTFRCLSRDQIAEIFFSNTKNATNNANVSLKRLRDRGYIDANIERQPFVYFPKPTKIKKDGNKVDHFLSIADVYIDLKKIEMPTQFIVEPRYIEADVRPDIFTIFKETPFWIEVQNSVYSHKIMQKKINLYRDYFLSGEYAQLDWQPEGEAYFPYILIITDITYKIEVEDIQVFQYRSIKDFIQSIAA